MSAKSVLLLALIALAVRCDVRELTADNFMGAKIVFNTIHDGYHSFFIGPVWNFQNKYLIFQSCQEETTPSVQRQFMDIVAAKFEHNVYAIPIFVFEPEINYSESPETRDIIMTVVRKYGTGLAVQISLKTNDSDTQSDWIEGFLQLQDYLTEMTHNFGKKGFDEVTKITKFLSTANLCSKVLNP